MKPWFWIVLPLALAGGFAAFFLTAGSPGIFQAALPPVERLAVQRIELEEGILRVGVLNDGPDPVSIAQVLVNGAYWNFSQAPPGALGRRGRATLTIAYPWVEGEPQRVTLVSSTGLTFTGAVEVATASPRLNARYLGSLGLLGVYIGIVPVSLGMLWLPVLRRLRERWFRFLLALTLGLLLFLGLDSLVEAGQQAGSVPSSLLGTGVLLLGFALPLLGLSALAAPKTAGTPRPQGRSPAVLAASIALGIGVHNLGEGLAIGGAYALGNVSLGALLVVGFMVHNLTEGVAVVAPLSRVKTGFGKLTLLALLAGGPAALGSWIGGFAYSPLWAVFFLAVGAGAIFQVVLQILAQMGPLAGLLNARNALGLLAGMAIMYGTGLLVAA